MKRLPYDSEYWVPERCIFNDAGACLDTMPAFGAAAGMVSSATYQQARVENDRLQKSINALRLDLELLVVGVEYVTTTEGPRGQSTQKEKWLNLAVLKERIDKILDDDDKRAKQEVENEFKASDRSGAV